MNSIPATSEEIDAKKEHLSNLRRASNARYYAKYAAEHHDYYEINKKRLNQRNAERKRERRAEKAANPEL